MLTVNKATYKHVNRNVSVQRSVPELYLLQRLPSHFLPTVVGYLGTIQGIYKSSVFNWATFICFSKALTFNTCPLSTAREPWWEVRNLAVLLINIIMIKAHKWLHSALSLTALPTIAHSCSTQWPLSRLRKQLPTAIWLLLSDQMGSFASLFVSVKWKRQQKRFITVKTVSTKLSWFIRAELLYWM